MEATATGYRYSARSTRNPVRYLLAVWRLVRRDPETTTDEAAIVELGFARSRLGRRFARWEAAVEHLKADPRTAPAMEARKPFGPIRLDALERLPKGTLGRVFADHCRERGIDPNLVYIPPDGDVGYLLNHLYQTHDIWHVVTGWGNDVTGEFGLGAFYAAQFGSPPFFGYMVALALLNTVMRRGSVDQVFHAISAGYQAGRRTQPLFGTDWDALWEIPIQEVRARFEIDRQSVTGDGIRAAA